MPDFMLLLHEIPTDFSQLSAEEIEYVIGEYVAWKEGVEANGQFVAGEKLADDFGKHLVMGDEKLRVTDGPFTESKEIIGGFFIISAKDYTEAVEISQSCPHLKYGGRIELRQVQPMD